MKLPGPRFALVAIGGLVGSVGRYWLSGVVQSASAVGFPVGTLAVNVLGSFAIGLFMTLSLDRGVLDENLRILLARELGLAGATVLRGTEGYGARSRIHTAKILRLSEDLPMVVEIVDSEEKIRAALPELDAMIEASGSGGLVTLEKAEIIKYSHGNRAT
jgi:protein CrcB